MTDPAVAVDVLGVAGGVVALWVGALLFVRGATGLARRAGVPDLVVGLTVVGFGTSAPELVTSVGAALGGRPDVAVGNVVGSNLFNFGVVLGVVLLLGAVPVGRALRRRDTPAVLLATAALAVVLADLRLARAEGVALLVLFAGYMGVLLRSALRGRGESVTDGSTPDGSTPTAPDAGRDTDATTATDPAGDTDITDATTATSDTGAAALPLAVPETDRPVALLARVVVGLGLVLLGADLLVGSAVDLARLAGVSEWVIGETVVAAGTSAPEIAASLVAARRGLGDVAVGNLVGSNVFNALVVLGAAGVLVPARVTPAAVPTVVWLAGLTLLVAAFAWTGWRFARAEGVACLLVNGVRWLLDLLGRGVAG